MNSQTLQVRDPHSHCNSNCKHQLAAGMQPFELQPFAQPLSCLECRYESKSVQRQALKCFYFVFLVQEGFAMGGILAPCSHPPSCCQDLKYWLHQQAMSSYCKISSTNFITTDKIWTRSEISDTNYMNTLIQQHLRSINIMGLQYKKFCSWQSDGTSNVVNVNSD